MKDSIWIVFGKDRVHRMTKNKPALERGELAIRVNISCADKMFETPSFEESINITHPNSELNMDIRQLEQRIEAIKEDNTKLNPPNRTISPVCDRCKNGDKRDTCKGARSLDGTSCLNLDKKPDVI